MKDAREDWFDWMSDTHGIEVEDTIEIGQLFFDTIKDDMNFVDQAYASGDMAGFIRVAHGMKGAALNLGFEDIAGFAGRLEREGDEKCIVDLEEQLNILRATVKSKKEALQF